MGSFFSFFQKAIAWIIGIVMAILGFLGVYKQPPKPVDPPTSSTTQFTPDPFETPEVDL